jgi:hypothetical protein
MLRFCRALSTGMAKAAEPKKQLMTRCRNEGAEYLSIANAHPVDADIEYDDEKHLYWYKKTQAPTSVTAALKQAFNPNDEFDADKVVEKWFNKWVKDGPKSEYYPITKQYTAGTITKEEAEKAIKAEWAMAGPRGTEMHRLIEIFLNEQAMPEPLPIGSPSVLERHANEMTPHVEVEYKQFLNWWETWAVPRKLKPYRTELSVVWLGKHGRVVCAGQIDGVLVDGNGKFSIADWKLVKPKKLLTVFERAYNNARAKLFPDIPVTDFHKYSFQASMYAVMMYQSHGIDAENRLQLIRMHKDLGEAQIVDCADYRYQAKQLLDFLETQQCLKEEEEEAERAAAAAKHKAAEESDDDDDDERGQLFGRDLCDQNQDDDNGNQNQNQNKRARSES